MVNCCVMGCSNRTSRKSEQQIQKEMKNRISFHRFPEDVILRQAWFDALQKKDFVPKETTSVCSEHFADDCFDTSPFYRKLSKTAVPTILPAQYYSSPLKPIKEEPGQLLVVSEEPSTSRNISPIHFRDPLDTTDFTEESTCNRIPKTVRHLISKTTSFSPDRRKTRPLSSTKVSLMGNYQFKLSTYKKKIKSLQQKCRRQDRKIAKMKIVINELKSGKFQHVAPEKLQYVAPEFVAVSKPESDSD